MCSHVKTVSVGPARCRQEHLQPVAGAYNDRIAMDRRSSRSGRHVRVLLTFAAAAFSASVLSAQTPSLGEVAKKEAERRKAQQPATKVYTNKDLPPSAQKPTTAPPPDTQATVVDPVAAATEQKPAEKPAEQKEEKGEAWWRARIAAAREDLRRNEMFAEALQTRINSLSRDFVNRDNPVQRAKIGQDRAEALNELGRVKGELERGKKQIQDIEEEARKLGVPPGWLR